MMTGDIFYESMVSFIFFFIFRKTKKNRLSRELKIQPIYRRILSAKLLSLKTSLKNEIR